jgi:hypothetical protein
VCHPSEPASNIATPQMGSYKSTSTSVQIHIRRPYKQTNPCSPKDTVTCEQMENQTHTPRHTSGSSSPGTSQNLQELEVLKLPPNGCPAQRLALPTSGWLNDWSHPLAPPSDWPCRQAPPQDRLSPDRPYPEISPAPLVPPAAWLHP